MMELSEVIFRAGGVFYAGAIFNGRNFSWGKFSMEWEEDFLALFERYIRN